jgi:hypothetical protein
MGYPWALSPQNQVQLSFAVRSERCGTSDQNLERCGVLSALFVCTPVSWQERKRDKLFIINKLICTLCRWPRHAFLSLLLQSYGTYSRGVMASAPPQAFRPLRLAKSHLEKILGARQQAKSISWVLTFNLAAFWQQLKPEAVANTFVR